MSATEQSGEQLMVIYDYQVNYEKERNHSTHLGAYYVTALFNEGERVDFKKVEALLPQNRREELQTHTRLGPFSPIEDLDLFVQNVLKQFNLYSAKLLSIQEYNRILEHLVSVEQFYEVLLKSGRTLQLSQGPQRRSFLSRIFAESP